MKRRKNPFVTFLKKRGKRISDPIAVTSGPHKVRNQAEAARLATHTLPGEMAEITQKHPSERVLLKERRSNPLPDKKLERIYRDFHITEPTEVIEVDAREAPEGAPDVLGVIGALEGVAYDVQDPNSAKKGDPWYHEFDEIAPGKFRKKSCKPLLCYVRRGRHWIDGGKNKITSRGIVG